MTTMLAFGDAGAAGLPITRVCPDPAKYPAGSPFPLRSQQSAVNCRLVSGSASKIYGYGFYQPRGNVFQPIYDIHASVSNTSVRGFPSHGFVRAQGVTGSGNVIVSPFTGQVSCFAIDSSKNAQDTVTSYANADCPGLFYIETVANQNTNFGPIRFDP